MRVLQLFFMDESGASAIEYGVIAVIVSVVFITSAISIGSDLDASLTPIATKLQ